VVAWTARACADLKAIHDYISKESPINAKSVVREIFARALNIDQTPRVGRRVPELDDGNFREVPIHSWRIIYLIRGDKVFIVALVHKRRMPTPEEIQRR